MNLYWLSILVSCLMEFLLKYGVLHKNEWNNIKYSEIQAQFFAFITGRGSFNGLETSSDTGKPKDPLKLVMNPHGQVQDINTLKKQGYSVESALSPDVCLEIVKDLNSPRGKGRIIFNCAKYFRLAVLLCYSTTSNDFAGERSERSSGIRCQRASVLQTFAIVTIYLWKSRFYLIIYEVNSKKVCAYKWMSTTPAFWNSICLHTYLYNISTFVKN